MPSDFSRKKLANGWPALEGWRPGHRVQLDNECDDGNYLLALKYLARSVGVDVPFYVITGWQGGVPKAGLLPLFGGYADGFWGGSH